MAKRKAPKKKAAGLSPGAEKSLKAKLELAKKDLAAADKKTEELEEKSDTQIEDLIKINDTQADEIEKLQAENDEFNKMIEKLQAQLKTAAETEMRLRKKKGAGFSAYGHDNLTEKEYLQILKDKSE